MNKIREKVIGLICDGIARAHNDHMSYFSDLINATIAGDEVLFYILSYLIESNEAPKDKVNTTGNPRNDEYIAEYNQANSDWRTYLKKKLED